MICKDGELIKKRSVLVEILPGDLPCRYETAASQLPDGLIILQEEKAGL